MLSPFQLLKCLKNRLVILPFHFLLINVHFWNCVILSLIIFCSLIICSFYVDNVPIREIQRTETMGGDFPSKPMSLYATIWDGSDWATNGGKYRVSYKYAPYIAEFSDFVLHGCAVDPIEQSKCDDAPKYASISTDLTRQQQSKMAKFRNKYMQYSYCYDHSRYQVPPSECTIEPMEAERLRAFDPVTFGGGRRHHGKRHHRTRSIPSESSSM